MTLGKTTLFLVSLLATAHWAGADSHEEKNSGAPTLVLADFEEGEVADGWKTVNDNVMGGRSEGGPSFKNGNLIFSGATNTDGGGFSSIRTEPGEFDLTGKSGLLIRARGDGRTYKAELRTDITKRNWTVPFRADFETVKGEWREFYLPLKSFTPTLFGQRLPAASTLDPAKVSSLGFMIYDKKDGAFSLEVDWVKAVAQDGGDSVLLLPPSKKSNGRQGEPLAKAKAEMSPAEQIEGAINRGVPIFNGGDPGKCAEIYKECLTGLAKDEAIDPKVRTVLKGLMDRASKAQSAVERAWLYRSGLDHLYAAITRS